MKLRQKIFFAFFASCLLVGGVTEALFFFKLKSIERDVKQVIETYIYTNKKLKIMTFVIQRNQTLCQELMAEKLNSIITKQKAALAKKEIQQELQIFENELSLVIESAEISVRLPEEGLEEKLEREKKLKMLEKMEAEFYLHKKLVTQYVVLTNTKLNEANDFLEETLAPHFRNKLLPLATNLRRDNKSENQ